jgi:AcrR family transcriptional regulator
VYFERPYRPATEYVNIDCTRMAHEKRRYEQRKRAAGVAATRQRITEATMELHGSLGPALTTVSAVAERAGVQRHTVYRHFPTDADLFAACSNHFRQSDPAPDPAGWDSLEQALGELYAYYERNESMYANLFRDEHLMPVVAETFAGFREYLAEAVRLLGRGRPRRRTVTAALRHAVDFQTWRSLARDGGLKRDQAVTLMVALIDAA